jgi:hypothetical protein
MICGNVLLLSPDEFLERLGTGLADAFIYLIFVGIGYLVLFGIFCCFIGLAPRYWRPGQFKRSALFFGLLLCVSAVLDGLWFAFVYDTLYRTGDYFCDFTPLIPFTSNDLDLQWGGELLGASLWEVQLVWLFFASVAWTSVILLYRKICGRWPIQLRELIRHRPFWNGRARMQITD